MPKDDMQFYQYNFGSSEVNLKENEDKNTILKYYRLYKVLLKYIIKNN